jgi:hypothetical protein
MASDLSSHPELISASALGFIGFFRRNAASLPAFPPFAEFVCVFLF